MGGSKNHRSKSHKIKPEWEDEQPTQLENPSQSTEEEESKLFLEAATFGKILKKDNDKPVSPSPERHDTKRLDRFDIDLHGLTVEEAQRYVIQAIEEILSKSKGQVVNIRVITGKGHRSRGREPQLIHSIHHVVESRFKSRLVSIEVSPHELKIGDSYLKGHFDLKIR
jgi:DNA-nicking Smr family endonuclease